MSLTALKPRQLEVFVTLADVGQMTRTAKMLSLTQPAVSMALRELERQLGPLFEREKRHLILNSRGRECLPLAREILLRLDDLERLDTDKPLLGRLTLGASNTVGNYLVGDLLGPFARQHQEVTLQLQVGNTRLMADRVLHREVDLACVEGPVHHPQLDVIPWRQDSLQVCASPAHPLAKRKTLSADDFADARWILREPGSATRSQSEQLLTGLPKGRVVLELGQVEAIKHAVMAGLGIACLPQVAIADAVESGRLCVLPTPFLPLSRWLSLVVPRNDYRGRLVEAFLASCDLSP